MNVLLGELKRSLGELVKGMDGQLNKTQAMEDLQQALAKNEVRPVADSCISNYLVLLHQQQQTREALLRTKCELYVVIASKHPPFDLFDTSVHVDVLDLGSPH